MTGAGWMPPPRHRFWPKKGTGSLSLLNTGFGVGTNLLTVCDLGDAGGAGNPLPVEKDLALPAPRSAAGAALEGASGRGSTGQYITPTTVTATVATEAAEASEAIIRHRRRRGFSAWALD